ncbi:hypothetical protein ACFPPA_17795 [Rhodanobacter ginsengisoli]|uniref:Uncharacterized protein n=1 Tax=Rhodanobacter ginsengisoli TaxID=418646 RepID=A0ABW0QRN4_9GAMM
MNTLLQRLLKAYRPLYLRGLLLDGRYHPPAKRRADDPAATVSPLGAGKPRDSTAIPVASIPRPASMGSTGSNRRRSN